jgi:hypothetical protein
VKFAFKSIASIFVSENQKLVRWTELHRRRGMLQKKAPNALKSLDAA